MAKKRILLYCWFIFGLSCSFAQANFSHKGFYQEANYFYPPFSYGLGYQIRKNDFSCVVPYIGFLLDFQEDINTNTFGGFNLRYKRFAIETTGQAELWAQNIKPFSSLTEYSLKNDITCDCMGGVVGFPTQFGLKRWVSLDTDEKERHKSLHQEIYGRFFLIDTGLFQASGKARFFYDTVPGKDFHALSTAIDVPMQINTNYTETCFLASAFYTGCFKGEETYRIAKSYEAFTRRIAPTKKDKEYYHFLAALEIEQRFYPFRFCYKESDFFLSAFANVAVGCVDDTKAELLYQWGFGLGYSILSTVPITLQIGCTNSLKPVAFISVISKILQQQ